MAFYEAPRVWLSGVDLTRAIQQRVRHLLKSVSFFLLISLFTI